MIRRSSAFSALALVLACGPESPGDDAQSGDGEGSGSADATSSEEDDGASEADPTTGVDETGSPVDDTCLAADPNACPDGCARGSAMRVVDDECTTDSIDVCIPGGPKPGVPPTSYWAMAPSGPVFVEYGGTCGIAAQPGTWTECSGAADEPADCACFCQQGYCRGDEDRRVLDECGLDGPCPGLLVDPELGAADHEAASCMFTALRDRVAGVYDITFSSSFSTETTRYYVVGDVVHLIVLRADDVLTCPQVSDWSGADRCALESSDFFTTCLELAGSDDDCVFTPANWVVGCNARDPVCE